MAKIIWSSKALLDKKEILGFWISKNKSNVYSKKLNLLIEEKLNKFWIIQTPESRLTFKM